MTPTEIQKAADRRRRLALMTSMSYNLKRLNDVHANTRDFKPTGKPKPGFVIVSRLDAWRA